jgi:glycosyltransferase involved in cell wall biosynthesis
LDYIVPGLAQLDNTNETRFETSIALVSGEYHDVSKYLQEHPFEHVHRVENPTGTIEGRIRTLENLITDLSPDLILVVNIADVYQAINNLRKRGHQHTRVVTTLHGIHPGLIDDIDQYHNIIDAVLVTNRLTAQLVSSKTSIDPSRILYAPYGVSTISSNTEVDLDRPFTVSYVGRIEEDQKRISDLLEILEKLVVIQPKIRILIAGDGSVLDMKRFHSWLEKQNSDNISFLGLLNPKGLRDQVYAVSDVLLLTSHWETGPIVAWEAFQYGLTLVSSKYIGHAEEGSLIENKNCLLFELGDTEQAVQMVLKAQSAELRNTLRVESKKLVFEKYSLNTSIEKWHQQLQVVSERKPKEYSHQKRRQYDTSKVLKFLKLILGDSADRVYENIRLMTDRKFKHRSPGSEWPHSYSQLNGESSQLTQYLIPDTKSKEPHT